MRRMLTGALAAFCLAPSSLASQQAPSVRVSTAVVPETVTVGDRFRSVIRVEGEYETIEFFDFESTEELQQVDSLQVVEGEAPGAVYPLVAWHTGDGSEARLPVRVQWPDGAAATYIVQLRVPVVRSVLPKDTTGLAPRPHRAVLPIPASPAARWWPWVLLALLVSVLGVAAWLLLRRQDRPVAQGDPRSRARRQLQKLEESGRVRAREHQHLYPAATRVLRDYLAAVHPRWGADLTSTELVAAVRAHGRHSADTSDLQRILAHADAVKFGRREPTEEETAWFWSALRELVERIPDTSPDAQSVEAAA